MLQFNTIFHHWLYGELYAEAKLIIDPDYDPAKGAVLLVNKKLNLEHCILSQPKSFNLTVTNKGVSELEILDISVSCTCVKLLGSKKYNIAPGQSATIDFEFTADASGELHRTITFLSNAVNPVETVELTAFVK